MFAGPLVTAHLQLSALLGTTTPNPGGTGTPAPTGTGTASPSPDPSGTTLTGALHGALSDIQTNAASQNCTRDDFSICGITLRITGSNRLGQYLEFFLGTPLRVAFIILIGWIIRKIVVRLIGRLTDRIATGTTAPGQGRTGEVVEEDKDDAIIRAVSPPQVTRRLARAKTLAQVLRSITSVIIFIVVALMVLDEVGLPITPLLASFSVIGVALGLGAQGVVRDVVAGMFMILEDQYGVGDSVNVGEASGTVEAVGLRVTQLRDLNGTVWYVRNGEILRVGNSSQGWSRAVLDVNVAYDENIDHVEDLLRQIADEVRAEPKYGAVMMEEPEIWGVESMTQDSVVVRMVVKTFPDQSAPVAREMRRRIRLLFAREGVFMHSTPRTMIVAQGEAPPPLNPSQAQPPADPPGSSSSSSSSGDSSSKRHPEERELGH